MIGAIEKGVPLSSDKQHRQHPKWDAQQLPFPEMEVGDSFVVHPISDEPLIVCQNRVSGAAGRYEKKQAHPRPVFTTRQRNGSHVRCWRVQ